MKKRYLRTLVVMMLLTYMVVNMCIPAMAASYIRDINIVVEDNGEAYPIIYAYDSKCYMSENISWNKEEDTLSVGTQVRGLLTLSPDRGYWFKKGSKITVNLTGSGTSYSTSTYWVSNEEECKILVTYTVQGRPDTPDEALWGESSPWIANASRAKGATGYEFTLYSGGIVLSRKETVEPRVDFSEELTKSGTCENDYVYFEVRATRGNNKSGYVQSYYFNEWDELKEMCDKVGNRTWKWKDSKTEVVIPPENNNTDTLFPPPPGA